jgi:phytoene dehydrogenase-like protein
MNDVNQNYDVVIIGAGLSGLTCGALLSRAGMSVAVLEMADGPGGYLAGFQRKGFRFDSSIHWLNQCGENGLVTRVFNAIGADHPKAFPQRNIRRTLTDSFSYLLTDNPDQLRDSLIDRFPHEKNGINKFFKDAKKIAKAFSDYGSNFRSIQTRNLFDVPFYGLKKAKFGLTFVPFAFYGGEEGLKKGLKKYFNDPDLLKFWAAESDLLSCLIPIAWAYNKDFQIPPQGGGQVYADWLSDSIIKHGNTVLFNTKVEKINHQGKKAVSVIAENKGEKVEFNARFIVAAMDVETLYEKIMDISLSEDKFLGKLRNAELYSSAVTVSLGLDCEAEKLGLNDELIMVSKDDVLRTDHICGDPDKSDISVIAPSARDKSMAPEGKGTLTIYCPAYFRDFEKLKGDEYKKKKREFAEILIDRVEKALSENIRSHIEFMDIATPITYHRYTGNKEGVMMGTRPGKANFQAKIAHYKTPLENVFLSGHWSALGGGVPIAVSTAVDAALLVLKSYDTAVFRKIGKYFDGLATVEETDKCLRRLNNV